ncbi:uncharacterized protein LOC124200321 [Daphnia pulex]|uniref:uncharacterized protein LOC124200321 n=1 Tax=Daphnia pulex TaxID=6669 RepID=UPI001EDFB39D|nr:uncharacterized protein LOC124200321 [Daphnia pulex]
MSPTVPTTTDPRDDEDNDDDPSWILLRQMDVLHRRVALSNFEPTTGVDQSTGRQQHQDRQVHLGWSCSNLQQDPVVEGMAAAAYAGLVTVLGNKGKEAESGDCWLMSHQQSSSSGPKGTTDDGGGVGNRDEAIKTADFWIHQLRSVLHETRSNLNLIVAFHQRQLQQQQAKQPATTPAAAQLEPSRAIIRSSQSDVAVQTELMNNQEQETGQTAAAAQTKSNYYRKSVRRASDDHVAAGSLIGQLSPPLHNPANAKATSSSRSKVLPESLEAGDGGCHFIRAGNSCCALSTHSCRFHSCSCCCRATNRQILSKRPSDSSRTKRTRSRKRLDQDDKESNRHDSTAAILLLNEAWQLAGLHTRQRMSILSRHYRILYQRHRRLRRKHGQLRRIFQRTRRRTLYVQLQLQILLESIGSQVDDVASDWVDRLKGLVTLQADGLMGVPPSSSSPDVSYSPLAKDSTGRQQQFRANDENYSFSLYRWYSSLSLKLSWLQTSHGTVLENLLLWIPRT